MTYFNTKLMEVVQRDPRYAYEAYEFVFQALHYTQRLLDREPPGDVPSSSEGQYHVSGKELLRGTRELALREFGLMARTVFRLWGINLTDDVGNIVFNLVEAELMSKTAEDTSADFHNVYDLDQALVAGFRIDLDEVLEP